MPYNLRGTARNDDVPEGGWTVRLLKHSDGSFVGEEITGSTGEFEFANVENIAYDLYAFDDSQPELGDGESPYSKNLHIGVMPVFEAPPGNNHRYWRFWNIDIATTGEFLEISELQIFSNGVNVTGDATPSSSNAPDAGGTLADILDGNLSTRCAWIDNTVEAGGFYLQFDFGDGNDIEIDGVKQGGFDTANRYMEGFELQYSDNGSDWTTAGTKSGLTYPGNNTISELYTIP